MVDASGKIVSSNQRFADMWGIARHVIESRSDELALQSVLDKLEDPQEFIAKVNYLYATDEKSLDEIALKDKGRLIVTQHRCSMQTASAWVACGTSGTSPSARRRMRH